VEDLFDSPTLLRDLASLLSAYRIGTWFTFTTGSHTVLLGIMIYMAAAGGDRMLAIVSEKMGLGQYLGCMLLVNLGAICTMLIPIRVSGMFEGPRWGRYFDQLVITGISPARYFVGKILSANIFFLLLVAASVPFAVFSLSLGGARVSYVLLGMLVLWLYANLLAVSVLAFAAFSHDLAASVVAIGVFGTFYGFGVAPLPSVAGLFVPSHFLMQPFHQALYSLSGGNPWGFSAVTLSFGPVTLRIGGLAFFLIGSLSGGAVALGVLLMGPVHCLMKENGTFGEVVMKGDSKRPSLFRRRYALRRRSEMSFLYENRTPWLTRWEALLRHGSLLLMAGGLSLIAFGILHYTCGTLNREDFCVINAVILSCCVLMAVLLFSHDRSTAWRSMQMGSRSLTVARCDTLAFIAIGAILLTAALAVPLLRNLIQGPGWLRTYRPGTSTLREARLYLLSPFLLLLGVQYYALVRTFCPSYWTRTTPAVICWGLMMLIWGAPFVVANLVEMMWRARYDWLTALTYLSPFSFVEYVSGGRDLTTRGLLGAYGPWITVILHVLLTAALVYSAWWSHVRLKSWAAPAPNARSRREGKE
jgi:hypothetical protein